MTLQSENRAPVYEIFFSYQGEGLCTGLPQIFIRFAGCNINCSYCDTAYSINISDKAVYMTKEELLKHITVLYNKNIKEFTAGKPSIAFTGGEPLIYADFLRSLLPELKKYGFSIYIETNATLPKQLQKVIKFCDIVSMDFKFASDCKKSFWKQHEEFLKISKNKAFVKAVITDKTTLSEIKKSINIIKKVSRKSHFILQPSTGKDKPEIKNLYIFFSLTLKELPHAHLMTQMHKVYNIA